MIFRCLVLGALFMVITSLSRAQQFGGNPPSLKWRQINTDTARIIFPAGMETQARQVAAVIHRLSGTTLPTIGSTQHKINIVFQNQTTIPNGYVALAPFRSEFQLTPEQNSLDLGSLPWQKTLAIHEYRHVQQYNNFRVGLSAAFYYLFGEGGQALANSLAIPNWFWEGDAVYQETLVSDQGRGRLPFFFNGYRSLWAAGKDYSWMKLRNGSLRDYVPDHYPLGYMLVAFGRQRYGDAFWKNTAHDAAAFRGLFYPMQGAIKRYSGLSYSRYTRDALSFFRDTVQNEVPVADADRFARSRLHFVANEEFPVFAGGGNILYAHSSYRDIPSFRLRDLSSGRERVLRTRAIALDHYESYRTGRIVYAAYETDPRWGWRDYSVIRVIDLGTGKDTRITSRSRYFAPDISHGGDSIVAVRVGADETCNLVLLDGHLGALLTAIPNRDALFYTFPKFFGGGQIVTAVRNTRGEMSLALVNITDGSWSMLLPFSFQTIAFPSVQGDTIWFSASRQGEDRIYGWVNGRIFRVRLPHGEPREGQYQFQWSEGLYSWNTFTAVGYRMDHMDPSQLSLQPLGPEDWPQRLSDFDIDSLNSGPSRLLDRIATGSYPVSKYPAAYHLINFHSWRPYINDPDYQFSLVSENILNTLQSDVFVAYNRNEQFKRIGIDATYGGWFPWVDGGWDYTFDRNAIYRNKKIYWNETEARIGTSVPLNFTRGGEFTSLQFGSDLVFNQRFFRGVYKDSFNTKGFAYIDPFIVFTHQIQQAQMQIFPSFAQTLAVSWRDAVTSLQAQQFLASAYLYFPGFSKTHSLVLGAAFQQRDTLNNARFSNSFPFSRGYSGENFHQMWRLAANYHFPLFYPEWGLGNIIYFLRIRANLFYDHTSVSDFLAGGSPYTRLFRSFGSEIYFDTKWWNELPISFGIRYSHLIDPDYEGLGPNQWELILPLNLLSQGYSGRNGGRALKPID